MTASPLVGPQHNHPKSTLRGACALGTVGRYSTARKAHGPLAMIVARDGGNNFEPLPSACGGVGAVEPRPTASPFSGPQHNHAKSALRGACALWTVGRYCTGNKARGPLVTRIVRGGQGLSKLVPPTYRSVGAVESRPTAREGVRPPLAHNTTMPSPQSGVWHVLHERSANTRRGEKRAGCAPRDSNEVATAIRTPCRRPVVVVVPSRLGRRRGEKRAPHRAHSHAKSSQRGACSVNGRSLLHGAKSARAARHASCTRRLQ